MRAYKAPKPLTSEEKGKLFDRYLNVMEDYYNRQDLYKAGLISCPYKWKYELVEWYLFRFGGSERKALKMSKKQLYAIWYRLAREDR
jgi:hypothetical protein